MARRLCAFRRRVFATLQEKSVDRTDRQTYRYCNRNSSVCPSWRTSNNASISLGTNYQQIRSDTVIWRHQQLRHLRLIVIIIIICCCSSSSSNASSTQRRPCNDQSIPWCRKNKRQQYLDFISLNCVRLRIGLHHTIKQRRTQCSKVVVSKKFWHL